MALTFGDKLFSDVSLNEYCDYLDEQAKGGGKYKKQDDIKYLWYNIFKVFDRLDDDGLPLRMTVRQMFYALVSTQIIEKSENAYKKTAKQLSLMRRDGTLSYDWIVDNTRWMRKPDTYKNLNNFLAEMQNYYRKSIWDQQNKYIEIWLEKDALAGVFYDITAEYDVPLMTARGFSSDTFIHSTAEKIKEEREIGKDVIIYYFSDFDPSGYAAVNSTLKKLLEFSGSAKFEFQHVAVLKEHIDKFKLPTRPTKQTDTRAKKWNDESVELDAIPPKILQKMIKHYIEKHIDKYTLTATQEIEKQEQETLKYFINSLYKKGE